MNTPKVLIVQNYIPAYRKCIYELIGEKTELTLAHSGKKVAELSNIFQVILKNWKISSFNFQFDLLRQLKKKNLVIAMFDIHWISSIVALYYCKWKKIPFYWWGHGLGSNSIFNILRIKLIRSSDGLILYSSHSKKIIEKKGINSNKLYIAPNTLEVKNSNHNPDIQKSHFIFVGKLRTIKRIPELLQAFKMFHQIGENEKVKLYIVGDGVNLGEYEDQVRSLGLEGVVIFTGSILNEEKLKELFQSSYAYVSPGDVGLGVLHSFAYGIPVVTRKEMGAKHGPEFHNIEHNINGLIYDGEIKSLAHCMDRFVKEKGLSNKLGKNAYDFYQTKRKPHHMINDIIKLAAASIGS